MCQLVIVVWLLVVDVCGVLFGVRHVLMVVCCCLVRVVCCLSIVGCVLLGGWCS